MFFVYILRSHSINLHYIGSTNNLERRLLEHNANKTKSLKRKGPFSIVYKEPFDTLIEARKREKQIKSFKGGRAFKKLLENIQQ